MRAVASLMRSQIWMTSADMPAGNESMGSERVSVSAAVRACPGLRRAAVQAVVVGDHPGN